MRLEDFLLPVNHSLHHVHGCVVEDGLLEGTLLLESVDFRGLHHVEGDQIFSLQILPYVVMSHRCIHYTYLHVSVPDLGDVSAVWEELAAHGERRQRARAVDVYHRLRIPFEQLNRLKGENNELVSQGPYGPIEQYIVIPGLFGFH